MQIQQLMQTIPCCKMTTYAWYLASYASLCSTTSSVGSLLSIHIWRPFVPPYSYPLSSYIWLHDRILLFHDESWSHPQEGKLQWSMPWFSLGKSNEWRDVAIRARRTSSCICHARMPSIVDGSKGWSTRLTTSSIITKTSLSPRFMQKPLALTLMRPNESLKKICACNNHLDSSGSPYMASSKSGGCGTQR